MGRGVRKGRRFAAAAEAGFGARLRALRLAAGLTQAALGAPDFTSQHIGALEQEKARPSRRAIEHLSARLGVTASHLRTGAPGGVTESARAVSDALALILRSLDATPTATERDALRAAEFTLRSALRAIQDVADHASAVR